MNDLVRRVRSLRGDSELIRWTVFALMGIEGLLAVVIGMALPIDEMVSDWKLVATWLIWLSTTGVFVSLNFRREKTYILHCFIYIGTIAASFWFMGSLLKHDTRVLPAYLPIFTDTGIFLGIGIEHLCSQSFLLLRKATRKLCRSILAALTADTETLEREAFDLPLHRRRASGTLVTAH